jgi:hypothetical protein
LEGGHIWIWRYCLSPASITHKILRYVIHDWLVHDSFYPINGVDYCQDVQQMQEVALKFSWASRGVINGCIGALDG